MLRQLFEQYQRATSLSQRLAILQEITAYVMQTGPRGGRFYYTPKGRKVYRVFKGRKRGTSVESAEALAAVWENEVTATPSATSISIGAWTQAEKRERAQNIAAVAKSVFGPYKHTQFTPKLLKKMFSAPGLTASNMTVSVSGAYGSSIHVGMDIKDSKGRVVGRQDREFRRGYATGDPPSIYHSLFTLKEEYQGGGRAGALFAEALKGYEKLGISKIDVTAAITAGPYTWARFGFNTKSPIELDEKKAAFKKFVKSRFDVPEKSLERMLSRAKNMRELSGLKVTRTVKDPDTGEKKKVTIPLGKQFLLYGNYGRSSPWGGSINLKDPKQVRTFKSQCKKGQKQRAAAIAAGEADDQVTALAQDTVLRTQEHWSQELTKAVEDPETKRRTPVKFTPQQWYESEKKLKERIKAAEKRRKEAEREREVAKQARLRATRGGADPTDMQSWFS